MISMKGLREGKTPHCAETWLRGLLQQRGARIISIEAKSPCWVRAVVDFPGKGTKVVTADIVDRPLSDGRGITFTGSQVDGMREAGSEVHVMFASSGLDAAVFLTRDAFASVAREELRRGGSW
jgi:hypothetical protein